MTYREFIKKMFTPKGILKNMATVFLFLIMFILLTAVIAIITTI